ncbi:potassium channel subfamily K member 16-like isoform X2 [Pseudophryne corroboree]|uniref:potassium channel subfamily K member 16-like isoform X2 n=1 Tax=Pseudophryne corroboree TaxID=495146 RepID=UPI0030816C3D
MLSRVLKATLLYVGLFVYLLVGAMMFQMMEQGEEENVKTDTLRHKLDFLRNYTCLTPDAMELLITVITDAVKQGVNPLQNGTSGDHTNWDLGSAFFFAGTVVTTIGYGTIAPRTAGGQMFCVFYALLGIPLNIIVLAHAGKTLSHWCKRLGKCLVRKGMEKKKAKILTIIFFLVTGTLVFLGLPPLVFRETEHWTYKEGVYYAFISLSTIGFGDYVVGSGPKGSHPFEGYRALVCLWILFGLAWLSLLLNLVTSLLKDTEKKIAKDLRKKIENRKENSNKMAGIALVPLGEGTSDTEPLNYLHK